LEGDETQPVNFIATPISDFAIRDGRFGEVSEIYKDVTIRADLVATTYANNKLVIPQDLANKIKENPEQKIKITECLYKDYENFVWRYCVIYNSTREKIIEETYKEAICIVSRWSKISGNPYGYGPFLQAMPDIKMLNKFSELMLTSAELSAFGVYTVVNNGAVNLNTAVIAPGMFIPVERNGGSQGASIAPLPSTGNFQLQEFMIDKVEGQIKKLLLDTKLPEDRAQPRTALEISQRMREFQADIGTPAPRIYFEFVIPLFRRIIEVLTKKGLLQLPDGFNLDNLYAKLQLVSPIAQTQAMADVKRTLENFEITRSLSPEVAMMSYKIEEIPRYLQDKVGGANELLRTDADKEELKQVVAQMMAAMQAQQAPQEQQAMV
jgi:hypothetical protein